MGKPNTAAVRVPCKLDIDFFKMWLLFLKPLHELTDREIDVAASFLNQRYELGKVIKDETILNKVLFSEDTKKNIKDECKVTTQYFHVILGKLKKAGLIANNVINPRFVPDISENAESFQLMILYDFS